MQVLLQGPCWFPCGLCGHMVEGVCFSVVLSHGVCFVHCYINILKCLFARMLYFTFAYVCSFSSLMWIFFERWSELLPMSPVEGCPTVFQVIYSLPPGYHQVSLRLCCWFPGACIMVLQSRWKGLVFCFSFGWWLSRTVEVPWSFYIIYGCLVSWIRWFLSAVIERDVLGCV